MDPLGYTCCIITLNIQAGAKEAAHIDVLTGPPRLGFGVERFRVRVLAFRVQDFGTGVWGEPRIKLYLEKSKRTKLLRTKAFLIGLKGLGFAGSRLHQDCQPPPKTRHQ